MVRDPENDLVERARKGDRAALNEIVRREAPRVARLLTRILGPRQDLDDLVQTVFLEMCRVMPRFEKRSTVSTFVGGITVQVAKRAMRPPKYDRTKVELATEPPSEAPGADERAFDLERLRRLHVSLQRLTPKKRIALVLFAVEGMTIREVAETMGATVFATRARVAHARKELRAMARKEPYLLELVEVES